MTKPHTFTANGELPRLYIPAPKCGHCFREVQIEDDYAYCQRCRIVWDGLYEDAEPEPDPNHEDAHVPCGITDPRTLLRPEYEHGGKRYSRGPSQPCILPSGHEGDHLCPRAVTVTPLEDQ